MTIAKIKELCKQAEQAMVGAVKTTYREVDFIEVEGKNLATIQKSLNRLATKYNLGNVSEIPFDIMDDIIYIEVKGQELPKSAQGIENDRKSTFQQMLRSKVADTYRRLGYRDVPMEDYDTKVIATFGTLYSQTYEWNKEGRYDKILKYFSYQFKKEK